MDDNNDQLPDDNNDQLPDDINDQDRLWAALAWIFWPIAIVMLLVEDMKVRPFQKYHAVNSLAFALVFTVFIIVISAITFGFGTCLVVLGLIVFYWAYQAYQGQWVSIPLITDFVKKQGWV